MHILVLGGSGRTGKLVIDEALKRGHKVTALVREPEAIEAREGSPLNKSDVENAFTSPTSDPPSAVIIALASTRTSDNPWAATTSPPRLMADSNANVAASMKQHGTRKLVTMQALGVGDSWPNLIFIMRWIVRGSKMSQAYADHNMVDKEVKESGLDYVLVRPTRLTEGESKPVKTFGNTGKGVGSAVTRASVAAFLVDAVEKDTWDRSTPVISN
ncbi:MAG: hypothetical protein Q9191_003512 [Dirinaria sp. TL-2023a]